MYKERLAIWKRAIVTPTVVLVSFAAAQSAGAAVVDEGFESVPTGNDAAPSVVNDNASVVVVSEKQVHVRGYGFNSDVSISTRGGSVFGTDTLMTTPTAAHFAMVGGTEINGFGNPVRTDTQGGGMAFGWSTATDQINDWDDGPANVVVGLAKNNAGSFETGAPAPTVSLAYANTTSQNLGAFTLFGDNSAELTENHWYLLDGVLNFLGYDAGTGMSSFSTTVSFYDMGEEGSESSTPPLTPLLSGSAAFSFAGDWSQAQPIFYGKDDRGFNHVDNLLMEVVPEPASLALLGLGGLTILARRRLV